MASPHRAIVTPAPTRQRLDRTGSTLSRPSSKIAAPPSVNVRNAGAVQFTWTSVLKLAAANRKNSGSENEATKFQRSLCCCQPRRTPRAAAPAKRAKNGGVSMASCSDQKEDTLSKVFFDGPAVRVD